MFRASLCSSSGDPTAFPAYSCLSCCSCCDAGELGGELCAPCGECCLTATTGQVTIGSGTQLDLLMMGIKIPDTC